MSSVKTVPAIRVLSARNRNAADVLCPVFRAVRPGVAVQVPNSYKNAILPYVRGFNIGTGRRVVVRNANGKCWLLEAAI